MTGGFFELAILIAIATGLGIAARILKQPVILAYLFTGILIGVFKFFHIEDRELFRTFSELGIMFLLFLIGLEINYTSLRLVGKISLIAGIAQIVITFIIGFFIAAFFHFDYLQSAYISIALTFSSTIIVVKLLSEKKDLNSLYGKISVGFLLVQDFFAILLLIFLSGIQTGKGLAVNDIVLAIGKGVLLIFLMFWLGRKVLPWVFDKIARSQELLFMTSLAWCLGIAVLVMKAGFSIEIGGFLAGLALANSSEHFQIATKIRSLRDFFILIFFVILGSSLVFSNLSGITWPIIIFSLFVLIGNPLIVLIIMGIMGYRKRTSFLCGVTVAQVSEFSLILAATGLKLGHLAEKAVSLITAVGIITIIASTYLIIWSEEIYRYFRSALVLFERKNKKEEEDSFEEFEKPIILIGCHRIGQNIASNLPKKDVLINDYDPSVITQMKRNGYATLFGDTADPEILEKANFKNARLVISTSPKFEDNLEILSRINSLIPTIEDGKVQKNKPKVILRAENERDAKLFYEKGTDYVLLPHFTSGQYLGRSIAIDPDLKILEQLKGKDLELMDENNKK
ncbi:cation:proton antiporter [Candidatus Wolfebacteria bacterium]|nr:cation:proton antiporter [Candidatus Wolfebacteria bacterium]